MREYKNKETRILDRIICNGCGKIIAVKRGIPMEGVFSACQVWEYMSDKDGETDRFDLCEECYDKITEQFRIPVARTEQTELL